MDSVTFHAGKCQAVLVSRYLKMNYAVLRYYPIFIGSSTGIVSPVR